MTGKTMSKSEGERLEQGRRRKFWRIIGFVELADNLWGSTAGYYAYSVLFPSWWVLGQAEITTEPNHWAIFFLSLAAGSAVYVYRKWRAR